jgi:hypothetical protein
MTSHHRQPSVQPTTLTAVPAGSHVTKGKFWSGPARMLTGCVVMAAICADALSGINIAAASNNGRNSRSIGISGEFRGGAVVGLVRAIDKTRVIRPPRTGDRRLESPSASNAPPSILTQVRFGAGLALAVIPW